MIRNYLKFQYVTGKMADLGIEKDDRRIVFGQLLGMRDHLTYPIGQAGYNAYKESYVR